MCIACLPMSTCTTWTLMEWCIRCHVALQLARDSRLLFCIRSPLHWNLAASRRSWGARPLGKSRSAISGIWMVIPSTWQFLLACYCQITTRRAATKKEKVAAAAAAAVLGCMRALSVITTVLAGPGRRWLCRAVPHPRVSPMSTSHDAI